MIELKNVTKKFGSFPALKDVDLKIETGITYGLLGSNGAGKSTILRLIQGIYQADGGSVLIDGELVYENPMVKNRIFFINDETVQWNQYTLLELKDYYKKFYPNFSEELFKKFLEAVKLPLKKKISQFSKGMKRQAIVIIGLAAQTDYLLMDEAFDGLDPTMRIIVKRMLVDSMLDRKLTTIISSHNLNEINEICDTVALIHEGKVLFERDIDCIKGSVHKIQAAFDDDLIQTDFTDINILHYEKTGSVYNFIIQGEMEEIKAKLNEYNPRLLDVLPLTLEEVFLYEMEVQGYDYKGINP